MYPVFPLKPVNEGVAGRNKGGDVRALAVTPNNGGLLNKFSVVPEDQDIVDFKFSKFGLFAPVLWYWSISILVLPTPKVAPGPPVYEYKFKSFSPVVPPAALFILGKKPNNLLLFPSPPPFTI